MRKYTFLLIFQLLTSALLGQTVDFTFVSNTGSFCAPSVVTFTQSVTGQPTGYIWDFGDGGNSSSANPSHTFANAGTFTVTLLVIFEKSTSTVSKSVTVNPANSLSVSADRNFICTPGAINFNATAPALNSFAWDFGDGQKANTNNGTVSHVFNGKGSFNVTVIATDTAGCAATASIPISLKDITVSGSASPLRGCVPANTTFSTSVNIPAGSSVATYAWDFGDGNTSSTATPGTSHTYSSRGQYSPKVTVTTSEGCTAEFNFPVAAFGTPPVNIMAYAIKDTVCASDAVQFFAKASGANQYQWQFGDGNSIYTSDTLADHKYNVLGSQNVTVRSYDNGCAGSSATFPVEIIGVVASFDYVLNCANKDRVYFADYSLGNVSSFLWKFGDGTQNDSVISPVHTYPPSGSFYATLNIMDSVTGCKSEAGATIYTAAPTLTNPDSVLCRNSYTTFTVKNDYSNPASLYTYHVAGTVTAPLSDSYLQMSAPNFGTFDNFVVIDNGPRYCKDTIYLNHKILVRGPVLDFTSDSAFCYHDSLVLKNNSHPYIAGDSITQWRWQYGDRLPLDSSFEPAPFTFTSATTWPIKLIAEDVNGCVDSLIKDVVVSPVPFLRTIPDVDALCAETTDTLIAFHFDPILWTSTASLPCNNCDTLIVRPDNDANYFVTATNKFGCETRDSVVLNVFPRFTAQALTPPAFICAGDTVTLKVVPEGKKIQWLPASGLSFSNGYDPVASPVQTTTYQAVLQDSAGCFSDSVSITINLKSSPSVDAGPDQTLAYYQNFSIDPVYGGNIVKYTWSPPGDLSCISCQAPYGKALRSNNYVIEVVSDSGCIATDSINIFIDCNESSLLLPNAFTPNNDHLNDIFYPIGRGVSVIKSFSIYDRKGQMVFSKKNFPANDPAYGWDGRINGEPVSVATFVYVIEALCDKGQNILKKGTVTLLK